MKHITSGIVLIIIVSCLRSAFAQELETETARLLKQGNAKIGAAFEYQTSQAGKEYAAPLVLGYGITDRIELVIEPVPNTKIQSVGITPATGIGDAEITLSYLLSFENPSFPAIALAGEIKIPTAKNTLIGTGKTDYAFYLIGSKNIGGVDLHANINYTIHGNPDGVKLMNTWFFAGAFEYNVSDQFVLFGEVYGNTASITGSESDTGSPTTGIQISEASTGEIVGSLGAGYYIAKGLLSSFSLSYDNNNATLLRAALSYSFPLVQ